MLMEFDSQFNLENNLELKKYYDLSGIFKGKLIDFITVNLFFRSSKIATVII